MMKRKDYSVTEEMVRAVEEAVTLLRQNPGLVSTAAQIMDKGMRMVSGELFGNPRIKAGVFPGQRELSSVRRDACGLMELGEAWTAFMRRTVDRRKSASNALDEAFYIMMDRVRCVEEGVILRQVKSLILSYQPEYLTRLNGFYAKLGYMWGALDTKANIYQVVENRIRVMAEHWAEMERVYERLADYRSRKVLYHTLSSWLTYDWADLTAMYENNFEAYWDLDLIKCSEEEVIVDLGAYTGDSVQVYIDTYGAWKRIYAYEMMEDNFRQMQENLRAYENIVMSRKAVAQKPGVMYIDDGINFTDAHRLADSGRNAVEVTTLDEDISEKITLIKLDIEGAERDALLGARRHIQEEKPKLLISVYHNNEDIWRIPGMLLEMREDYRLYLRSNGRQYGPVDMVLFAV